MNVIIAMIDLNTENNERWSLIYEYNCCMHDQSSLSNV